VNVFHYILGRKCMFCGRTVDPRDEFCERCRETVREPFYRPAAEEDNYADFLFYYYGPVREGLHRYKYHGYVALGKYCGRKLAELFRRRGDFVDVVTCVPRAEDGLPRPYNQSGVIASVFAKELGVPFDPELLRKRKGFRSQTDCIDAHARERNANESFRIGPSKRDLQGLRVILIDDLYTTGSTVNACERLLLKRGAGSVSHYTAMRVGPWIPRMCVNPDYTKEHVAFQDEEAVADRMIRRSPFLRRNLYLRDVWRRIAQEKTQKSGNQSREENESC